jgi:hypothetical protein
MALVIPFGFACFTVSSLFGAQSVMPTLAIEGRAKVAVGNQAEVLLQAIPYYGNTIAFEIQDPPRHGSISSPKNISDHTATVTYSHDGSEVEYSDDFSFRAQAPGHAKSSCIRTFLEIISSPPHLVMDPPSIDFGKVIISEKSCAKVVLTNTGGRLARGRLLLGSGFIAPEGDGFSLKRGESMTMVLEFQPMEQGDISSKVTCNPFCESTALELKGVGLPRFDVFKKDETAWLVKNLSEKPCRVSFTGGHGWQLPPELLIAPYRESEVLFQPTPIESGHPSITRTAIVKVSDGSSVKEIGLPAPSLFVPIVAESLTPAGIGTISIGSPASVSFRLRNDSKSLKQLHWRAVSTSGGGGTNFSIDLKSGDSRDIRYDWSPTRPGRALLKVQIEDAGEQHEMIWNASVNEQMIKPFPPTSAPVVLIKHVQEQEPDKQTSQITAPAEKQRPPGTKLQALPPVEASESGIRTNFFGGTTPYIKWDLQDGKLSAILLEHRIALTPSIEEIKIAIQETKKFPETQYQYNPLNGFHHKKEGNLEILLLPMLPPGTHTLTLTLLNGEGLSRARSDFEIRVPYQPSFWSTWRTPLGILGILFLLLLLRFR